MSLPSTLYRRVTLLALSLAGTALAWGLSTAVPTQAAPGSAPILVVVNGAYGANPFGNYLGEILRAEGLNAYDVLSLSAVTAGDLTAHKVTLLAETNLSVAQAALFNTYVTGGGRLIAMRPDSQIAGLFGLTGTPVTQTDGYLKYAAGPDATAGLTTAFLQIHGTVDRYAVSGGEQLAGLYTSAKVATGFPAVVRGSSGRAVAFTYDLARNVVYTRQGNPALANRLDTTYIISGGVPFNWDAASPPVTRTIHLFGSPDITNSVPLWIDRDLIPVPQADEQMRLLARLVKEQIEPSQPMPQLWYFPGTAKTMLVLTGDAHANPSSSFARQLQSLQDHNAKITLYMTIGGTVTDLDAVTWEAQGNTFGLHPYAYRPDGYPPYNITSLAEGYTALANWFTVQLPSVARSRTVRHHQVAWLGWTDAADLAVANGMGLDTNFYHWGPWLQRADGTWPHGYLTGSGQTMRFIRADGTVLPLYQQLTELVDEQLITNAGSGYEGLSGLQATTVSQGLIDASQAGDYAALMTQFHVDYYSGDVQGWAEATVDYAHSQGVPVWNADAWLDFTEVRHDASYTNLAWNAATRTLSFTLTATNTAALTLTTLLPNTYQGYGLTTIQVDGAPAVTASLTVKGETQTAVLTPAGSHNFVAVYTGPLPSGTVAQTTYADLAQGCVVTSGVHATDQGGGALSLDGALLDEFSGSSLAGTWQQAGWDGVPYTPTVGGGVLTLPPGAPKGGYVESTSPHGPGVFEAVANFGAGASQHIGYGFASTSDVFRFFLFSTYSSTTQLYARANNGITEQNINLGTIPAGWHRYRIEWLPLSAGNERALYYIDGKLEAQIDIASGELYTFPPSVIFSNNGAGTLNVDWVQESPTYVPTGTYTSCVLDAGQDYAWNTIRWDALTSLTTTLGVETRTSFDSATWSPWAAAAAPAGTSLGQPVRFAQYRLTLATSDVMTTPVVYAVNLDYAAQAVALARSDGGLSPTIGQAVPITLTLTVPQTTTFGLRITDTVPAGYIVDTSGITLTGLSPLPNLTPSVSAPNNGSVPVTVGWNFGDVTAVTDTLRLVYTATVANLAGNQAGTTLTGTAQLVNLNSLGAIQPAVTAADSQVLAEPALLVTKTVVSGAGQAYPGGVVTYQVAVGHPGGANTSPAYDIVVTDSLPAAVTLAGPASISSGGGVDASAGNMVTVTAASLAAGGQLIFTYPVTVSAAAVNGQLVSNTAAAAWTSRPGAAAQERTGAGGLNDYRVTDASTLTVQTPALKLEAGSNPASAQPGQAIVYTFYITNSSPVSASGLGLTATLPATLTFQSASNGGSHSSGVVTWTGLAVGGNASTSRTLTAQLANPVQADLTQVSVDALVRDDGTHGAEASLADNTAAAVTSVDAAPNLALTASDGGASVAPGGAVTYTLSYSNGGDQGATGVTVTATVPAEAAFYQAGSSAGWSCSDGAAAGTTCSKTIGAVAGGGAGGSAAFAVRAVNPVAAGLNALSLTAGVSDDGANGADANPANNLGADSTPVNAAPELALTASDGGVSVTPGAAVTYTLTYTNAGDQGATGVTVTATVPANSTFDQAGSAGSWSCSDGAAAGTACSQTIGGLTGGGAHGATAFAVRVVNPVPAGVTALSLAAGVSDDAGNGADPVPANNTAADSTPVSAAPELGLTVNDGVASVTPGAVVVYTLSYSNAGDQGATGVTVTATVPANTTFNTASSSSGWSCSNGAPAGTTCNKTIGGVAGGGANGTAAFAVLVANPVPAGVSAVSVSAGVSDDAGNGADAVPGNNLGTDSTPVNAAPELALTVSDGGASVVPGGVVTYTLSYSNPGNQGATGVAVTATVPADSTFNLAGSSAGWNCADGANAGTTCSKTIGAVAGGGAGGTAAFAVRADNPVPAGVSALSVSAGVSDDGGNGADAVPGNNLGADSTPVNAAPELAVTVSDGGLSGFPGEPITYTLAYTNAGNQGASGVTLTTTVPLNTLFSSAGSDAGWDCANGSPAGTLCQTVVGNLNGGGAAGTVSLVLVVNIPLPIGGNIITTTVGIKDDNANGADPVSGNNRATDTTPLVTAPNLSLGLAGPAQAVPGELITYTVTYSNTGNAAVNGFTITYTVPAGTTAAAAGWSCPAGSPAGTECTWSQVAPLNGGGTGGSLTFPVTVTTPAAAGLHALTAQAVAAEQTFSAPERTLVDNTAAAAVTLQAVPNLALAVNDAGASVAPGGLVTYTLAYTNAGNQDATGVVLTATVPANAAFNLARSTAGWVCANAGAAGAACHYTVGNLGGGQAGGPLKFVVNALNPVAAGATALSLSAVIADDGGNGLDPAGDNQVQELTPLTGAAGDLLLGVQGGDITVTVGSRVSYTLVYTNAGNRGVSGVVLTATVPAGAAFDSGASTAGWVCSAGVCTLARGTLAGGGASGTAVFAVGTSGLASPAQMRFQASAGDDGLNGDADPLNNAAAQTTGLIPATTYVFVPFISRN